MKNSQWRMDSAVGPLYLVVSPRGLRGIFFRKQKSAMAASLAGNDAATRNLRRAVKELGEYFTGKRKKFGLKLDAEGTAFQKKVWKALAGIPYGKTRSYKDVARTIRNGKAVRAVGSANGKNPLCVVVPCHRVIAADGTIGGYSGGMKIKEKLLRLEKAVWI